MQILRRLIKLNIMTLFMWLVLLGVAAQADDYAIGIGDTLKISVWGNKDLNNITVVVRPDGKISFPLLKDELLVDGLTPMQLKELLTKKLSEYINNPELTVTLLEAQDFTVYVYGIPGAGARKTSVNTNMLQFLSQLGPLPQSIDLQQSYLIRRNKKLNLNFLKLLTEGDLSQNEVLRPGDTIFFKEFPPKAIEEAKKMDVFADKVRVIGEVSQQGTIEFKEGMTILDAVLISGGFTPYARPNKTKLVRKKGNKIEEIIIDMDAVRNGEIDKNIRLEPGDVISVPASLF